MLWAAEEGLKSGAVSAVVMEVDRPLALTPSRRLQLAAEIGGGVGFALGAGTTPSGMIMPNAITTRWQVDPMVLPGSSTDLVQGVHLRLDRVRGGFAGNRVGLPQWGLVRRINGGWMMQGEEDG